MTAGGGRGQRQTTLEHLHSAGHEPDRSKEGKNSKSNKALERTERGGHLGGDFPRPQGWATSQAGQSGWGCLGREEKEGCAPSLHLGVQ